MHASLFKSVSLLLLAAEYVYAHGAITGATGDQGGNGMALGVDPSTPRDGTRREPFQQDSTRFRENTGVCGETLAGGTNNVEAGTQAMMAMTGGTLPQVSAGGQVDMTLHQVNGDGAGPYTCEVDMSGTGQNFQPATVTQQVPGRNSRNRQGAETDFPLTVQMPANMACTGTVAGQSNVCMVRCMNGARAGPFGGCVPVQQAGAAAAAAPAAAPAAAAPAAAANANNAAAAPAANNAAATGNAATGNAATGNTATGNAATGATGRAGNAAGAAAAVNANRGATRGNAAANAAEAAENREEGDANQKRQLQDFELEEEAEEELGL